MTKEHQAGKADAKQKSASLFPPLYNPSNGGLEKNSSPPLPPIYNPEDTDED